MTLQIGRVTLDDPESWDHSYSERRQRERIRGVHQASTLAQSKADLINLVNQTGEVVPVVFSQDSSRNGLYRMSAPRVDSEDYVLNDTGQWDYSLTLERIGTYSSAEFQGLIDNQLKQNDHGLIASEINWWHSPPIGSIAYTNGDTAGSTGLITRTGEDGESTVAVGIPDTSPQWTIDPANYYKGGCYIAVGGQERAGFDVPLDADDWELGNHLVKVTPGLTTGSSNGEIEIAHYDGAGYATAKAYAIKYASSSAIPSWDKMRIIRNTPELCIIELVQEGNEGGGNKFTRHNLRLAVRRGGLMVMGYYYYDGAAAAFSLDRAATEAGTAVTPTGASSAMAIRATSNDGDGNRYVIGSSKTNTADTTNGGLDFTSTNSFDFFISSEIDGSSAQTQDQAGNQCLQYVAVSNEQVRPVPR